MSVVERSDLEHRSAWRAPLPAGGSILERQLLSRKTAAIVSLVATEQAADVTGVVSERPVADCFDREFRVPRTN